MTTQDNILKAIQSVIDAWDAADAAGCNGVDAACEFTRRGDVQPLRDLITLFGNPNKPKPQGIMQADIINLAQKAKIEQFFAGE